MKDTIRKVLSTIIALIGIGTIGYYAYNWVQIIAPWYEQYKTFVLILFAVLFLAFFLQFGIVVFPWNRLKIKWILAGLVMILAGNYLLVNNSWSNVFASDIVMLLGVCTVYLTAAGLIVTKKAEKAVQSWKQTIIEV